MLYCMETEHHACVCPDSYCLSFQAGVVFSDDRQACDCIGGADLNDLHVPPVRNTARVESTFIKTADSRLEDTSVAEFLYLGADSINPALGVQHE